MVIGGFAVLNGDDPWIRKTEVRAGVTTWWYGQDKNSDFNFRILKQDLNGSDFHLTTPMGSMDLHLPTTGEHNIYNAVAAAATSLAVGGSLDSVREALKTFHGAPGRLEKVPNKRVCTSSWIMLTPTMLCERSYVP